MKWQEKKVQQKGTVGRTPGDKIFDMCSTIILLIFCAL